jgi:hypothetical protein
MDEKEEKCITVSSFITHPSYFLSSLRVSVSPCLFFILFFTMPIFTHRELFSFSPRILEVKYTLLLADEEYLVPRHLLCYL